MSGPPPAAVSNTLRQAIDHHRAGRRSEAESAYLDVLEAEPEHPEANHHLGVLMVQSGRIDGGIALLGKALQSNRGDSRYWLSYVKGLLAAGDVASAAAVVGEARARGDAQLMDGLGSVLLAAGRIEEAIQCYRDALAIQPEHADTHHHLGSVLSETGRIAEGFSHFMRRAALVHGNLASPADKPEPTHKRLHDQAQRDYLAGRMGAAATAAVAGAFTLAEGERIAGPAVDPANSTPELIKEWNRSSPQAVVIDGFLTQPALLKLRHFCAGSTVWKKIYPAGYLGAAPEDGFACPLLAQIVAETQATFRAILDGATFQYLGAFKYDSENCAGTNTHADNALINVNLYITPDVANLDPEHGGMKIWNRAATDIGELRRCNSNETALHDMLERSGASVLTVPHRANRAVIFKSTLFHRTDTFRFRSEYLARRINVSMLFGHFG